MKCKISVIIPVFNVENYATQCLESILNQTFEDIEIICINDGSTDSSKKILEKYMSTDKRISVLNKTNGGYGAACNAGIRLAKGEYISIIEPDDFIKQNMYEDLYDIAVSKNADVVKSAFYEYRDMENSEANIKKINWSEQYNMPEGEFKIEDCPQFFYFHPSIWSCIYKRDFLKKHNITFVEAKGAGWTDNPFQVQTLCLAQKICYTDNAYYYYRLTNPTSSSNIVNISNPFDRSDEVHTFLKSKKIKNKNLFAHLYKRELSYIDTVLCGISSDLLDFACKKISEMILRMNKHIIYNNKHINEYEKSFYELCRSREGILCAMSKIKERNEKIKVVKEETVSASF